MAVIINLCDSPCSSIVKNYQHILALAFAVKEVNENPKILSNITLGFHILNNYYTAQMTYRATLGLLSTQERFVPNYRCGTHNSLIAVIGGLLSKTSFNMATLLKIYKIPQVGCVRSDIFSQMWLLKAKISSGKLLFFLSVCLWNMFSSRR